MKLAHCLQHVSFEGPGAFRSCLETRGFEVRQQLVPQHGLPPELGDFLLIMGGPMSVNDPDRWIEEELIYIQTALSRKIPIVGVCLGSQFLSRALGTSVTPSENFEIGMVPITFSDEGCKDPIFNTLAPSCDVFQWHGEGFELPEGTTLLASSDHYPVQAYRYGTNVYALLFHLELEESGIRLLCQHCPEDVVRGGISEELMVSTANQAFPRLHACADRLIEYLASETS